MCGLLQFRLHEEGIIFTRTSMPSALSSVNKSLHKAFNFEWSTSSSVAHICKSNICNRCEGPTVGTHLVAKVPRITLRALKVEVAEARKRVLSWYVSLRRLGRRITLPLEVGTSTRSNSRNTFRKVSPLVFFTSLK